MDSPESGGWGELDPTRLVGSDVPVRIYRLVGNGDGRFGERRRDDSTRVFTWRFRPKKTII
jgi:hypothetical protein